MNDEVCDVLDGHFGGVSSPAPGAACLPIACLPCVYKQNPPGIPDGDVSGARKVWFSSILFFLFSLSTQIVAPTENPSLFVIEKSLTTGAGGARAGKIMPAGWRVFFSGNIKTITVRRFQTNITNEPSQENAR